MVSSLSTVSLSRVRSASSRHISASSRYSSADERLCIVFSTHAESHCDSIAFIIAKAPFDVWFRKCRSQNMSSIPEYIEVLRNERSDIGVTAQNVVSNIIRRPHEGRRWQESARETSQQSRSASHSKRSNC